MPGPTRLDYCQYLLSSPINYTLTHFADHTEAFSHDQINRYLAGDRITPRLVWENVQDHLAPSSEGYILFDDTVLDKRHGRTSRWCVVSIVAMPTGSSAASAWSRVCMFIPNKTGSG